MNNHQSHHDRIDAVLERKTQRHRGQDGDRRRSERTEAGDDGGDQEHDPGNPRHMSAHQFDRALDQPIDSTVDLGDGEQVGNADQCQEEVAREASKYFRRLHSHDERADQKGAREGERAHIDRLHGGDHEHADQQRDRQNLDVHSFLPRETPSGARSHFHRW